MKNYNLQLFDDMMTSMGFRQLFEDLTKNRPDDFADPQSEQYKWFVERTNKHIGLVKKACGQIVEAYPEFEELLQRAEVHDASKFEEPEKTPYIEITWRHKLENSKDEFDPINNKGYKKPGTLDNEEENKATLHHITSNQHHPEFHLKVKSDANISATDRDKSDKVVDASAMPDLDVAEMVADWQAMTEELGKNTTREWFDKQKDVRWHFSDKQIELIDKLIKVFEDGRMFEPESIKVIGKPKFATFDQLKKDV